MKLHLNSLLGLRHQLVLASASPRRSQLMKHVGFDFATVSPDIDEDAVDVSLPPSLYVQELARRKAERGAAMVTQPSIIIGSDTTVVLDDKVLNKPIDEPDARRMLSTLSGRTHTVYTGLALIHSQGLAQPLVSSRATHVTFRTLAAEEIAAYVETGSPLDKAGAYGIQDDFGAMFVSHIEGCYYTIVGLPLELLYTSLRSFARELTDE